MSLNSSGEDSEHLSKLQEQNGEEYKDAAEEVEDSGKRKSKKIKESIQRKQKKKERLRKQRKMGTTKKIGTITKRWISSICLKKIHVYGFSRRQL